MPDTAAIRGALNQVIARGESVVTMVTDLAATAAPPASHPDPRLYCAANLVQ